MTRTNWYYEQYTHNKKLADQVLHSTWPEYDDWSITSMFYSALHLINAYCLARDIPLPNSHHARKEIVKNRLPQIREEYENLFDLSMQSRYTTPYYRITELDVQMACYSLEKIEKQVSINHKAGM